MRIPSAHPRPAAAIAVLLAGIGSMLPTAAVRADQGPPVHVRLVGPPHPAQIGQTFADTVVVQPDVGGVFTNFRLEGTGWTSLSWNAPSEFAAQPGQQVKVAFSGIPVQTAGGTLGEVQAALVRFYFQGTPAGFSLDVSAAAYQRTLGPLPTAQAPPGTTPPPPGPSAAGLAVPDLPAEMRVAPAPPPKGGGAPQAGRNIRVHGRFGYWRSDNQFIGGDGVAVLGYDDGGPQLFAVATDAQGTFDVTFFWSGANDPQPDIYLKFVLENSKVYVNAGGWFASSYSWKTGTVQDYAGTDLDFGTQWPGPAGDQPAVHVHTDLVRTWRWLQNRGYDCPRVGSVWPDGSWSFYTGSDIHVFKNHSWNENVHIHEYGHHFVHSFATAVDPSYCNGICDTNDCGHCSNCPETDHDAFGEGAPEWLEEAILPSWASTYGVAPLTSRSWESMSKCGVMPLDPWKTEGIFAGLLQDIEDSAQDADPLRLSGGTDGLALGTDEILACIDLDQPTTPAQFLNAFRNRFPQYTEGLWQTARNNNYDICNDGVGPAGVTNLTSTSHGLLPSTNPRITWTWTRASDNCSGTAGYSIEVTNVGPWIVPNTTQDIGDVTTYVTAPLAPGNWWLVMRAVDRAGNWSPTSVADGPYVISAPQGNDLQHNFCFDCGWGQPLIPCRLGNSGPGAPASPVQGGLDGDAGFYVNNQITSFGASSGASRSVLETDGNLATWWLVPGVGANQVYASFNVPAPAVSGGMHTLVGYLDYADDVAETNEGNNTYGIQWAWKPVTITGTTPAQRGVPPLRYGGTGALPGPIYENCDGMRFATNPLSDGQWWVAVWMHALDNTSDYDLRLFAQSTNPSNGFRNPASTSANIAGSLDAVIVNANNTAPTSWDAGIYNWSGVASGDYRLARTGSTSLALGDSLSVTFATHEMLRLWEVHVFPNQVGPLSIVAQLGDPNAGPMHLAWFDRTTTTSGLFNAAAITTSDPKTGQARLDLNISSAGYYGVVAYRDPTAGPQKTGVAPSSGPMTLALEVQPTPPDLVPLTFSGWYAPVVPRPAADGSLFSVPQPASLPGDGTTFLNLMSTNAGPMPVASIAAGVVLDGVQVALPTMPIDPERGIAYLNSSPQIVAPGGRHTLSMRLDPTQHVEEISETNNRWGEQWVWAPARLGTGIPVTRMSPPALDGGWSDVTTFDPLYYDCDGLGTPLFVPSGGNGYWAAVAIMPGGVSDVDVRLHEAAADAKTGFAAPLMSSDWSGGASDYVTVNFRATPFREFDAGSVRWSGTDPYTAEVVASVGLGGAGTYGPFTLGSGHILHLYEVQLPAGMVSIRVDNLGGNVDWGMTLHPAFVPYDAKLTALAGGVAATGGPGQGERVTTVVPAPGWYAIAVWKAGPGDLPQSGTYRLVVNPNPTDALAMAPLPTQTALSSVRPNPFNPSTTIQFDVAEPGQVELEIYTLGGRRLRTLYTGTAPAGRHEVGWDGTDDAGRRAASGIYFVRLRTAATSDQRKLVMLK
jgi:hypothetical protein